MLACLTSQARHAQRHAAWPSARLTIGPANARPGAACPRPGSSRRRCWPGWPRSKEKREVAHMMPFRIGADASCTDGACGQVSRVIVNPVAREVTHLAVDPKRRYGRGRLVPIDLVDAATGQIRLRCTLAEFQTLRRSEE